MELDKKLACYKEDVLLLEANAAALQSHVLYPTTSNLVVDLRKMVDNIDCSDVVFKCQDGQRVRASRMLLAARSTVFKSMLRNGMAESTKSEIVLPVIPSDVLVLILKFVYTGEVWEEDLKFSGVTKTSQKLDHNDASNKNDIKFSPFTLDWLFVLRVIKSGRFLLLDALENVMITRLWKDLPRRILYTDETMNKVTERLTILCSFVSELSDGTTGKNIDILGLHLVKIVFECDLNLTHLRNLSFEAMHYYFYHTHSFSDDPKDETWTFSFREYVKVWQAIMWSMTGAIKCIHSVQAAALCLPEPNVALSLVMNSEKLEQFISELPCDMSELRKGFAAKIQRDKVEKLTQMVNFVCIHPELLIHIVEPLNVISPEELGNALKDQLIRASRWRKRVQSKETSKCQWQVGEASSISTSKRLTETNTLGFCFSPTGILAVANVAMWCHSVYEWQIVQTFHIFAGNLLRPMCEFTTEVGFVSLERGESIGNSRLSSNERGWALRIHNDGRSQCMQGKVFGNGKEVKEGLPSHLGPPAVHFTFRILLDRVDKTCSIVYKACHSVRGVKYCVTFKTLPGGLLFPAVHVFHDQSCCTSETRIDLIRGFE